MEISVVVQILIFIFSVVALCVGVYQYKAQNKRTFYLENTKRYRHIIELMPEDFFLPYKEIDKEKKTTINHYVRMYIDLCSEQYFLKKKKFVDKSFWTEWKEGIVSMFKNQFILDFWKSNDEYYKSEYNALYRYINENILEKKNF